MVVLQFSKGNKCKNICHLKSKGEKLTIEKVIPDLVCSLSCPVNSFTDVPFIMAVCGESAFWSAGECFAAIPAATSHWVKLEATLTRSSTEQEEVILKFKLGNLKPSALLTKHSIRVMTASLTLDMRSNRKQLHG